MSAPLDKGVHLKFAHTEGFAALRYTPDGKSIVTCGADTLLKIFEADNFNAEPRSVEYHQTAISALAIHPKGGFVVTASEDNAVNCLKFPSCEFDKLMMRSQHPVRSVAFNAKGKFLAAGLENGSIRLIDAQRPSMFHILSEHKDSVLCVAFDPKGDFLASSSADGTVRIWDITNEPKQVKIIKTGIKVTAGSMQMLRVAWHPMGDGLAMPCGSGIEVLERETWKSQSSLRGGHTRDVSLISWCANGRYLCSVGLDKQLFLWDLSSAESLDRHKAESLCVDLMWSPKDNALAFIDDNGQLALWQLPVPKHYPSPVGDSVAAQSAPVARAADTSAIFSAPDTAGAAAHAPREDEDEIIGQASDEETGGAGAAGNRRRLRKVLHDSDDGGFSDHDDDEAAEAAMLAAQIKRHGVRAIAEAAENGTSVGAPRTQMLAALAAAGPGVAAQPPLHPSSTPAKNGRRFLLWNLTGMVISRDENVFSAIEVDFNDTEKHRTLRMNDHYGFSMASLDDAAVVFGSRSNNGNPSTVVYRPLASWAPNSEWQVQLERGEETVAVALGFKLCVVATDARYLRVYSHTGAQRAVICTSGPIVTIAASGGMLAVVQHIARSVNGTDQGMELTLYDMHEAARPVRLSTAPLPLSEGATLHWIGFSDKGVLCTVDSKGIARACLRSYSFEWTPLLNCNTLKKNKNEHHWMVGVTDNSLMCVICKGDDPFPATLPRPVISALPISMPLACAEPADPALEKERLLSQLWLDEYRACATDEGTVDEDEVQSSILKGFTKLDSLTIKLLMAACKGERNARALDLVTQLRLPKSLVGAMKLANHYKLGPLAERISMLMEAKYEEGERAQADVELAPPREQEKPKGKVAPIFSKAQPQKESLPAMEEGADEVEESAANSAAEEDLDEPDSNQPASAPLNPFGKGATGNAKSVQASNKPGSGMATVPDTAKTGKRKMPVSGPAAVKKVK